jgi:S-adenosylmethionine:tRNA ribosyltransferase-isomerase
VLIDDFDYHLPREMIAQEGIDPRDAAKLMVMAEGEAPSHRRMGDLPTVLSRGDVLVVNETRVIPARLRAKKLTGGRAELLLLSPLGDGMWEGLVGGGRLVEGSRVVVGEGTDAVQVEMVEELGPGRYSLALPEGHTADDLMARWGEMPTPPYIRTRLEDQERYQTTYARVPGSVAAPTAGLHFNDALIRSLERGGIDIVKLTLHVGYGTFQPVRVSQVEDHRMESERVEIAPDVADAINDSLDQDRRVVAVGTTTVRSLESATDEEGHVSPFRGATDLFIYPGYTFRFPYSGLLTNFHLPRSTLLMLVSAYWGRDRVLAAYEVAKANAYRFYSLGDGMLFTGGPMS